MKKKKLYSLHSPYQLSAQQLVRYDACARCFYLDAVRGVALPWQADNSFSLIVKKQLHGQLDIARKQQLKYTLSSNGKLNLVPFKHKKIKTWRTETEGIVVEIPGTNLALASYIDDLWINPKTQQLHVVIFCATGRKTKKIQYSQEQIAQAALARWLLVQHNFEVSNKAVCIIAAPKKTAAQSDQVPLSVWIDSVELDTKWIEQSVANAYTCLKSALLPPKTIDCATCNYFSHMLRAVAKASIPKSL